MNLFKPIEKINKKYQVIILSNILEYLYDDIENYSYQSIAAKNINNLLESNGIAISSNIIDYHYQGNEIFEKYFDYIDGPIQKDYFHNNKHPICYVYKKK